MIFKITSFLLHLLVFSQSKKSSLTPFKLSDHYVPFDVAAKYAAASYCNALYLNPSTKSFDCGPRCKGSANGTILEYAQIEPKSQARGYVAINPNLETIFISFKGMQTIREYWKGAQFWKSRAEWTFFETETNPKIKLHAGFEKIYKEFRTTIFSPILKLARKNPDYKIVFTGHSLGAALVLLTAVDFYRFHGFEDRIFVYTFGKPRIGNEYWADYVNDLPFKDRIYRLSTQGDLFSQLPFRSLGYVHEKQLYVVSDEMIYECTNDEDSGESSECLLPFWELNGTSHLRYWDIGSKVNSCKE
jgi:hypothetical protein